jgi:hypothetical protein
MQTLKCAAVLRIVISILAGAGPLGFAEAAGPWKGQIVDAETSRPLEGVVVLAVWTKYTSSLGGWAAPRYWASQEVVTGPDGHLVIEAQSSFILGLFSKISGPEFTVFKPGYGQWRFRGSKEWPRDIYEYEARSKEAWKQFANEGAVIELPPLRTREERLRFLHMVDWSPLVPWEKTRRIREAESTEREYLGLRR